jgi:hypothetical protein
MLPLTAGATEKSWQFFGHLTTDFQNVAYAKNLWSGSLTEFPGQHYVSTWVNTDNVKYVSDSVLQVWGRGNNIYAKLATPQSVQRPTGQSFDIPAFSLELHKYGESFQFSSNAVLAGYYGASDYTVTEKYKGYNAHGAFMSEWNSNGIPVSDDSIVFAKGTVTFYPPTFGNTNIGTYQDRNDAHAKSASYFICSHTGTITDIFAYVARVGAKGDGTAAIYADNGGSPGALIAATNKATVGKAFSWVDFHLALPVSVTAGTGYWLAITSNNALNLNIVVGSGVRVHNSVSSWFSDPFGPVWDIHDAGAMSIYAR